MSKSFDLSVIFKAIDQFSAPVKKIGKAMTKLKAPVTQIKRSVQALRRDKSLKGFGIQMQLVRKQFKIAAQQIKKDLKGIIEQFQRMTKVAGQKMKDVGKNLALKITAPLSLMGAGALKASISFESAFTGVRKTVNATEQEFGLLKKQLMGMALELPLATEEIFGIAEAAGQLGIKKKDIAAFTKVMADLGATTNLSADEAATSLARFANITAMSQKDFDKLGSVIVDLGNNMATTEGEIVAMGMRLAGAGKTIGLMPDQIMAFSAALSSVGIQAEAGGTAFSQVMKKIDKEIGSGSDKIKGFALVSGQTVADFEKMWEKDAAGALMVFVEGLDKAQKKGVNVNTVLDELGMEGIRISDSLLRAAGAGDLMREALGRGSKAWEENSALMKEAELRYKTSAAQLTMAKNKIMQLAASFGDVLVPVLMKVIHAFEPLVNWMTKLSPEMKIIITTMGVLTAIIPPLLIAVGLLVTAIGAISAPILGVIAAITGLGLAAGTLMAYWEPVKGFFADIFGYILGKTQAVAGAMKKLIPNWLKKRMGISDEKAPAPRRFQIGPSGGAKELIGSSGMTKSETDIHIKLQADTGTTATIQKVKKKKGDAAVSVASQAYVGAF